MAPQMIIPEHGFHPSCGDFGVSVVVRKRSESAELATIRVQYDEWADLHHSVYSADLPWDGGEVSAADIQRLLDSAKVPAFIQDVSAIGMILRCVNGTLADIKDGVRGLSSISVKIESDKDSIEFADFESDDEDMN